MKRTTVKKSNDFTQSSGNVFADLGLPDAEELHAKARLGAAIAAIIKRKGLTQHQVGQCLNISQPRVSALVNYKFDGFSVEKLMQFLTCLDCEVQINIVPLCDAAKPPRVRVSTFSIDIDGVASTDDQAEAMLPMIIGKKAFARFYNVRHSIEAYACAFGIDKASPPVMLPRMT